MKVGILTFQQAINYGAVLQLYALQKTVQKLGIDSEVINYISPKLENDYKIIKYNTGLKNLLANIFCAKALYERKRRFKIFEKKYLNLTDELYYKEDLTRICNEYDYVITGSDQVWNYAITDTDSTYMLNFVEDSNKKISYAASFGVAQIPDELKVWYKNLLQDFKAISVREKHGQKILKEICNRDITVTLDPTLLLDKYEWGNFCYNFKERTKYILVYSLRNSNLLNSMAKNLKIETGYDVIVLNPRVRYMYTKDSRAIVGPEEFVNLFFNAEYVLTDSFHGTAFSINFNKKFLCELNTDKNNVNSRLESLFDLLNLKNRTIDSLQKLDKIYDNIDYNNINNILNNERRKSLNYLKMSLGLNE